MKRSRILLAAWWKMEINFLCLGLSWMGVDPK